MALCHVLERASDNISRLVDQDVDSAVHVDDTCDFLVEDVAGVGHVEREHADARLVAQMPDLVDVAASGDDEVAAGEDFRDKGLAKA